MSVRIVFLLDGCRLNKEHGGKNMEGRGPYVSMAATHCAVVNNALVHSRSTDIKNIFISASLLMLIPNDIKIRKGLNVGC